ncbi:MAG: DUF4430 domain-containing protein [Oscillospiraceae bacterium]|nr:DUF4430 domain-containing protein [Oscillospiraceae bacterium]
MKKYSKKNLLSLLLCAVLIAAMALTVTGCSDTKTPTEWATKTFANGEILGEGSTEFTLIVVDAEGTENTATIRTDKTVVGDALLELELINGPVESYGIYVKTVNGMTYDYDTDGKYWAFYIDGEYALTGIDQTELRSGAVYTLKAE